MQKENKPKNNRETEMQIEVTNCTKCPQMADRRS